MIPAEYVKLELYQPENEAFVLGTSRLGRAYLTPPPAGGSWVEVQCHVTRIMARSGGLMSPVSTALSPGQLHATVRNDLNPLEDLTVHPGMAIRVRDTRQTTGNQVLWTGWISDIDASYDKDSGDWVVTIAGTDAVRDLQNKTIIGLGPAALDVPPLLEFTSAVQSIASAAGVSAQIPAVSNAWTLTNVPALNWARIGSLPAGMTTDSITDLPTARVFQDRFTSSTAEPVFTLDQHGWRLQVSGLELGQLYLLSVRVSASELDYGRGLDDFHTYRLVTATGDTGLADSVRFNGKSRPRTLSVGFRASNTSMIVYLRRHFEGRLSESSSTATTQTVSVTLGNTQLRKWNSPFYSGTYPLQPQNWQTSAFNQLTAAADSARWDWWINENNVLRIQGKEQTSGVFNFSDEHAPGQSHECYINIERGFNTADMSNAIALNNHGRRGSSEVIDQWNVADEDIELEDTASIDHYRRRENSLDTMLNAGHTGDWSNKVFPRAAHPHEAVSLIECDAAARPTAATRKLMHDPVVIQQGKSIPHRIVGVRHDITATTHKIAFELRRREV